VVKSTLAFPGGLRIKKITNYSATNIFANATRYYYLKDFNPITKTGKPSGILAFTPKYYWETNLQDNQPASSCSSYYLKILTSGSTSQAYYNLDGSAYVGYWEVVECKEDVNGNSEGYVKNKYTNFGAGYFDDPPLDTFQSDKATSGVFMSPHTPFSSNSKKRGKLFEKDIYDKYNILKEEYSYKYITTNNKSIRNINMFIMPNEYGKHVNFGTSCYPLGGSYLTNIYNYLLSEKTEMKIENSGNILTISDYTYNTENKVVNEKTILNNNDNFELKTTYTGDLFRNNINYMESSVYKDMESKYMYAFPIEKVKIRNGKVISSQIGNYKQSTFGGKKVYFLSDQYNLETNASVSNYQYAMIQGDTIGIDSRCKRYIRYSTYNQNVLPNFIETNSTNTVYLWSYRNKYPIAEIKNATYQQIQNELGESYISDLVVNPDPNSFDLAKINSLRVSTTLPGIVVTTFTFRPYIGMLSKTDPRGVTTFYKYDDFGRLKTVFDNNMQAIQNYDYHLVTSN